MTLPSTVKQFSTAPFEPTNIIEALKLAETLAASSLVPTALRNKPADVLVILMKGRELGLPPMASLAALHVIDGKACCSSDVLQGIVLASGKCEFFELTESTSERATYRGKRKDSPNVITITWTMDEAKRAKLVGKSNWMAYPNAMLRARAASDLAREGWPDVCSGLYDLDEEDDIRSSSGAPVPAEVVDDGRKRPTTIDALKRELAPKPTVAPIPTPPAAPEPAKAPAEPQAESAPWDEPEAEPTPEAQPEPDAGGPQPLDPAQPNGFVDRMRFPFLPEPWETWADSQPWPKGLLKGVTPREAVDGSVGGKRHKGLDAIVSWTQAKLNGQTPESIPHPAILADYCLAYFEAKNNLTA